MIKNISIKDFKYGLLNSIEDVSIPRGACSNMLNFLTKGTKVELRRGYTLLGTTENTGTGKITGLGVAKTPAGVDIVFRTRKRKIEYLNRATNDWVEVGSDIFSADVVATDALGEDISIEPYSNPTGSQVWFNSPKAGPYKIMTANPANLTSMYVGGVTNFKGRMRIKQGRMFVWNRAGNPPNRTDLRASKLDVKDNSTYTQISAEVVGSGNASNKTFTGTLAFKAAGARRVCFEVVFTDGTPVTETFLDNGDGTLTGSAGGVGTINYTSGDFSITFITAPSNTASNITATYRWADDSSGGIADFAFSATRVATEGFILKQALGGDFQNLASLNGAEYCFHKLATWVVTISGDDLSVTNLIYRSKVGIPNHRAMVETGDGVYYIDDTDQKDPQFRLLYITGQSAEVIPKSISKQFKIADIKVGVDLSSYYFDLAASVEFGDFVLFACRTTNSAVNNRVFVYNKTNGATDVLDYYVSAFGIYDGGLIAGDSVTDNVYTLFSSLDDLGSNINAFWESSLDNLGFLGIKKAIEVIVDGDIGPEQKVKLLMSVDRGAFVEVRSPSDLVANVHAIEGSQDYIDRSQRVSVGPLTLGRGEIGGGGDGVEAYHYRRSFRINIDRFEYVKFRLEPTQLGYFSLSELTFHDVRVKREKIPIRYRVGR